MNGKDYLNERVKSTKRGFGVVTGGDKMTIKVRYDESGMETQYAFPDIFNISLSFCDQNTQVRLQNEYLKEQESKAKTAAANVTTTPANEKKKEKEQPRPKGNFSYVYTSAGVKIDSGIKQGTKTTKNSVNVQLQSPVLKADIHSTAGNQHIQIVENAKEQDTANGIYWRDRSFALAVLEAETAGKKEFTHKGITYSIEDAVHCRYYDRTKKDCRDLRILKRVILCMFSTRRL